MAFELLPEEKQKKRKPTLEEFASHYNIDLTPVDKSSSTLRRAIGDTAVSLGKGIVGVGETAIGAADLLTGGQVGKALEDYADYNPKQAKGFLDEQYTNEQKEANRKVQEAEGFIPTLAESIKNPSTILQTTVESAPSMLAGGAVARGLGAVSKLSPVVRGAIEKELQPYIDLL